MPKFVCQRKVIMLNFQKKKSYAGKKAIAAGWGDYRYSLLYVLTLIKKKSCIHSFIHSFISMYIIILNIRSEHIIDYRHICNQNFGTLIVCVHFRQFAYLLPAFAKIILLFIPIIVSYQGASQYPSCPSCSVCVLSAPFSEAIP